MSHAIVCAAFDFDISHSAQNAVAPAGQSQDRRKTAGVTKLLLHVVSDKRVVRKDVLIDPVFRVVRSGDVSMDMRRDSGPGIGRGLDRAKLITSIRARAHDSVNTGIAIVSPVPLG